MSTSPKTTRIDGLLWFFGILVGLGTAAIVYWGTTPDDPRPRDPIHGQWPELDAESEAGIPTERSTPTREPKPQKVANEARTSQARQERGEP